MTKGDNLLGTKTFYKGIEFKSTFETQVASLLDYLNIKWEYEPKKFRLSNRIIYIPDFYLTELKMWIEVKGKIEEHNKEISRLFVRDNNTELILLSYEQAFWFSMKDYYIPIELPYSNICGMGCDSGIICEDSDLQIGFCSECKSYFFVSNLGSYHCRKCETHNGDHDIEMFWNNGVEDLELFVKIEERNGKVDER